MVHEDDAGVGARGHGLSQDCPAYVGMAARLEQESAAEVIRVTRQPGAFLRHRASTRGRKPVDDEPQRRPGRVGIDGTN
jgi:hypothetical protein